MGSVEWILQLTMSPDGRITGVAPVGRVTLFTPIDYSVTMVRDPRPVSGRVEGDNIVLTFNSFDNEDGAQTYTGRFTGPDELGGNGWMAERY